MRVFLLVSIIPVLPGRHVGILKIRGIEFKMEQVPLQSVRPFAFADLVLAEEPDVEPESPSDAIAKLLERKVNSMVTDAAHSYQQRFPNAEHVRLPLVRLRVRARLCPLTRAA